MFCRTRQDITEQVATKEWTPPTQFQKLPFYSVSFVYVSLNFVYRSVMYFHNHTSMQDKILLKWSIPKLFLSLQVVWQSHLALNSDWSWGSHQYMGYVPLRPWKWAAGQKALYQFAFFSQQTCYGVQVRVIIIDKLHWVVERGIRTHITYYNTHTINLEWNSFKRSRSTK